MQGIKEWSHRSIVVDVYLFTIRAQTDEIAVMKKSGMWLSGSQSKAWYGRASSSCRRLFLEIACFPSYSHPPWKRKVRCFLNVTFPIYRRKERGKYRQVQVHGLSVLRNVFHHPYPFLGSISMAYLILASLAAVTVFAHPLRHNAARGVASTSIPSFAIDYGLSQESEREFDQLTSFPSTSRVPSLYRNIFPIRHRSAA